ncbi:hypothetical protein WBJ53_06110 [Spirosoma sp. SC4-14]|uniref:hypothetical protein n=1 Tax=Spirosoma sp. SC4-14 TaxID=3128900 RepID=UPI0030CF2682
MAQLFDHDRMRRALLGFLESLLQLILFSNAYIAFCAVIMCQTTALLFDLALPRSLLAFVFAGTLGSYSLHWYLTDLPADLSPAGTQRLHWNQQHKKLLLLLFLVSALIGLRELYILKTYLYDLFPVVILAFLYTAPKLNFWPFLALRRIAILKTAYLSMVWTYVTVGLPLLINATTNAPNGLRIFTWALTWFVFIYSIAFWFDYRDRSDDGKSKWLTLVSMLTNQQAQLFFRALVVIYMFSLVALFYQDVSPETLICLSLPMILLVLTSQRLQSPLSDYAYYLYLDGLLMIPGLLMMTIGH